MSDAAAMGDILAPLDLQPKTQPQPAADRINTLRAAGFNDQEIASWSTERRAILSGAGFNDDEINQYLGNRPPPSSPAFFDRAVSGTTARSEPPWPIVTEFYKGAVRSGASLLYSIEDLANKIEEKLGLPGAEEDVKQLARRKAETEEETKPAVPGVTDIRGGKDAASYVFGKIGEIIPTAAEYLAMGVPRMVLLGAIGGALRADEQNQGNHAAVATGAVIGAAAAGAPAPFLSGAVGKGLLENVVKSVLGMGIVGGAQTLAEPLPKAAATGTYTPPTMDQVAEGVASGALAGAIFGTVGGLTRQSRDAQGGSKEELIGTLPENDDFANAMRSTTGNQAAPLVAEKLARLWSEYGIHPSEVGNDAAADPVLRQQLLSSDVRSLPERYTGRPRESNRIPAEPAELADHDKEVLSRVSVGEQPKLPALSWDRFYTAVIDRLNPIRRTVSEATGGEPVKTADDPYQLARLYAGVSGKAERWLNHSTFDFNTYGETGKSLRQILEPVTDAKSLSELRSYGTALRAIELEGRGIATGVPLEAARASVEANQARYQPVMNELVAYQNKLAAYLRDSGVLSKEGHDAMVASNPMYLPFQRVFGDNLNELIPSTPGTGKTLQAQNPIHEILGSERRIVDPLESIIRNTYLSLMMAEKNAVGTKLVDVLEKAGGLDKADRPKDTITILREGVKEVHEVDADLAAAMKGLNEETANKVIRLLGAPARLLRAGATLSPDFIARNPIRDFFEAALNTTKSAFSPIDTAKGFYSAVVKDKNFEKWLAGGGGNSELVAMDRRYLQEDLADLTAKTGLMTHSWNVVRHPIDTLRVVSETMERATRIGEFRAAYEREIKAGSTEKEATQAAAMASREVTIDFARRGAQTQAMNMITAFWNASVQGIDRTARAIHDNSGQYAIRAALGITLPSALLWVANHDDPRWKDIPDWQRDLFWLVMTGDGTPENPGHIYRIPKPFAPGVAFGSGVERMLDAWIADRPNQAAPWIRSVIGTLIPGVLPTIAVPFFEQWANRSSFADRTLIPDYLEKQLPEYRATPYTTQTAQALGQLLSSVPGVRSQAAGEGAALGPFARALTTPILMENYIRAWTGGSGQLALQLADKSLRAAGVVPDPPKPDDTLADIPVVRAFVVRYPSASAQSIQTFYDEYAERKRYFDTWQARAKVGDTEGMERIMQAGGTQMFLKLDNIHKALGTQAQLVRSISLDPSMSPTDKRQLIDSTYLSMISLAQAGNEAMKPASTP